MLTFHSVVLAIMFIFPAEATERESDSYLTARQAVKDHFLADDFDQAARGFEALWEEYQQLPDLYAAGLARYRLEHHAHAVEHWEHFLELAASTGFEDPKVERAKPQLEDARNRVFPKLIIIDLPTGHPPASAEMVLQSEKASRPPMKRKIEVGAGKNTVPLRLDSGSWTITANIDGKTEFVQFNVPSSTPALVVFSASAVFPQPIRRQLSLGLSLPGLALAGAGVGILIPTQYGRFKNAKNPTCGGKMSDCLQDFQAALRLRDIGAQVAGGGVGFLISGLTTLAPTAKGRRGAWVSQIAIGGGLAAAGTTLYFMLKKQNAELMKLECNTNKEEICHRPQIGESTSRAWDSNYVAALARPGRMRLVNSILLGTGAGLLTGATIGLLVQRPYLRKQTREKLSRVSVTPNLSSQNTGLLISGAF